MLAEVALPGAIRFDDINLGVHSATRRKRVGNDVDAHQTLEVHIPVRASFATLLGRIMPFWMATSTLLNLLLLLPFEHLGVLAGHLAQTAFAIQVFAVLFSLGGPVPINNRIKLWTPTHLPTDWKAQEHRWDLYHWFRTAGLIVAFALLVLSALH